MKISRIKFVFLFLVFAFVFVLGTSLLLDQPRMTAGESLLM